MIKVMYLIEHLVVGGAENLVRQYAQLLDRSRFEVVVVCSDNRTGTFIDEMLDESGVRVIYLGDLVHDDRYGAKSIEKYRTFEQIYAQEQPDIIHTNTDTNDYLLTVDTEVDGVKLFHSVHRDPQSFIEDKKLHLSRTQKLVQKRNMKLITLHGKMNESAKEIFQTENAEIVRNGIDIHAFQNPLWDSDEMRLQNDIPQDAYVMGTVSRLRPVKNHRRLLRIFKAL